MNAEPKPNPPVWTALAALCLSLLAAGAAGVAVWLLLGTRAQLRDLHSELARASDNLGALQKAQESAHVRELLLQAPNVAYEWSSGFGQDLAKHVVRNADGKAAFPGTLTIHNRSAQGLFAVDVTGCFSLSAELVALPYASVTGICSLQFKADALGAGEHATIDVAGAAAGGGIDLGALLSSDDDTRWEEALTTVRHSHQKFAPTLSQPDAEHYSIPLWGNSNLHATALYARIKVGYSVNGVEFQHILTLVTGTARAAGSTRMVQLVDRVMKQPVSRIDTPPLPPLFVSFPQNVDNHDAALVARIREAGLDYTLKTETDAEGHVFETGLVGPLKPE